MPETRWKGYIKDYSGSTMMQCKIHKGIDYAEISNTIKLQRKFVIDKIHEIMNKRIYSALDFSTKVNQDFSFDFTEILGDKLIKARNYRIGIISRENMCNLNHKIIVLSSLDEPQLSDTKFEEIVISSHNNLINRIHYSEIANYVPDIRDGLIILPLKEIKCNPDLIDINKFLLP